MDLKRCSRCNDVISIPYHVTEISRKGSVYVYDVCEKCGDILSSNEPSKEIQLDKINTAEQLLEFISGIHSKLVSNIKSNKAPCPNCGLSIEEFDKYGRFGCGTCYQHFEEKMEELVYPYHKANCHVGKTPKQYLKNIWNSTVEEKTKLLKLRLAKAVELEEYEKAGKIKIELQDLLSQEPESFCEDQ